MSRLSNCVAAILGATMAFAASVSPTAAAPPARERTLFSKAYPIDRIYKSMQGPKSHRQIKLLAGEPRQLLWIVGYRTEIVNEGRSETLQPDFMCHNNLNLGNLDFHQKFFQWPSSLRMFTLSQGQMAVRFPSGFGIPIISDEPLIVNTQVLNHNIENPDLKVRHMTTFEFVKDSEVAEPMKALFQQGVQAMVLVEGKDGHFHGEGQDGAAECSLGTPVGPHGNVTDPDGRTFNGHWVVEPGIEERHTRVTPFFASLPAETRVHFLAVHLHPFAVSLELRDLTADRTVYKASTRYAGSQIGLDHVDQLASVEGLPIHRDHEYELISVYDNTSDEAQDAMAVMFLYHHDESFRKPTFDGSVIHTDR